MIKASSVLCGGCCPVGTPVGSCVFSCFRLEGVFLPIPTSPNCPEMEKSSGEAGLNSDNEKER